MDNFVLLGVLLIITVIVGAFMGIFAFAEVRSLRVEVRRLRAMMEGGQGSERKDSYAAPASVSTVVQKPDEIESPEEAGKTAAPHIASHSTTHSSAQNVPSGKPSVAARYASRQVQQSRAAAAQSVRGRAASPQAVATRALFWTRLQENWMVWLGGACVALAGVFLARYGIEQGLLGPKVRVAMGLVTAVALYVASEVLRRKTGSSHPTFAALAGGGAITAFAAVLSAVHLYHLMAPGLAFGLLAVVAMITMWLARLHGPVLAAIGMLGAYSVPAMVSTGSGNVLGAMIYALIISVSVLFLLRHVYRAWLWLGLLAGALAWWLISLVGHQADDWRGVYLAVLAYLLLAVVPGNWSLTKPEDISGEGRGNSPAGKIAPLIVPSLLVLVAAQCLSILREGFQPAVIWAWSPLAIVVLVAARQRASLALVPWTLVVGQLVAWLAVRLDHWGEQNVRLIPLPAEQQGSFLLYLLVTAALFAGFALFNYRRGLARYWWASLAVMAPLLTLLTGYVLAGDYLPVYWWCLYAAVFGAVCMYLGSRGALHQWHKGMVVWLFIAAHFAYSLAVCLWLEQASLTLALALQAVSLAWIVRRFEVPALGWLLKAVLLLVVVRLTLNPWLLTYSDDSHWSLWTYGGSALCAWVAARILSRAVNHSYQPLAVWAEAVALHLLVLALWAECRYWLYGGNAFAAEFSFTEAVINMWLFTMLGLVYYRKSRVSDSFSRWYDGYSRLLVVAGLGNYLAILFATATSAPWAWHAIGERPVFNMLVPAFAGAALLAAVVSRFYLPGVRRLAALIAAVAAFVWVSLEVRHLWQGSIRLDTPAETGELYTYSAVWLALAVAGILLGSWRGWRSCYQGGMAVLALVIVKLFLVDMSGLEGLLRVASFMGMGLALLGIAYLHQKLGGKSAGQGQ
ncbi:DUF2339 domain-containing protein [Microbulbifer hydrolyticus]|uniref:DUF2339 domain-containing protein n=1 Tax=Microbulbifer hydrolyticus TaxID=48074 RepID=A0A6P1T9K8_9GAMM|nr:DUF2339 domain-containing protein [Microbulbifer hydrolyticus]MBB5212765.1 putative membrane protein [Microbulbifer hydrolyticus]QHQ38435.1 DUF2339 domain-containing protein [Microbulbifer hydrolyticus]